MLLQINSNVQLSQSHISIPHFREKCTQLLKTPIICANFAKRFSNDKFVWFMKKFMATFVTMHVSKSMRIIPEQYTEKRPIVQSFTLPYTGKWRGQSVYKKLYLLVFLIAV